MATAKAQKNTTKKAPAKKAPVAKKAAAPKEAGKLSASIFNISGKEVGTVNLPEALFGQAFNNNLVHQVVVSMQSNARAGRGLAHTKDRGEVRGGGKKPWKQKGTGRARHGSSRSPLWTGGGVTHGPRNEKNYEKTIPRKMRIAALRSVLSQKFRDGEIIFLDSISFAAPKTKDALAALTALSGVKGFERLTKKQNAALIALSSNDTNAKKSFANFGNVDVEEVRNLNVVDVLSHAYLIVENPDESLKTLSAKLS